MDAGGMYAPLSGNETGSVKATPRKRAPKMPLVPVPVDAPPMAFKHPKYGAPSKSWLYQTADGRLVGYVCRWDFTDTDGKPAKEILPVTYCDLGDERFGWRSKGIPTPRPLYGLPAIALDPNRVVIIVEGEKTRDAAQVLFPDAVVTTPAHGAKSSHLTDFTPLAGRIVVVAPDHDESARTDDKGRPLHPGRDFGDKVAVLAREAGAAAVLRLAPEALGLRRYVDDLSVPRDGPLFDGWDLADALAEGWTAERVATVIPQLRELPAYPVPKLRAHSETLGQASDADECPFRTVPLGVEKRLERVDRETGKVTVTWRRFCSPLVVSAETRSAIGEDWGRLLEIVDRDGRTKAWSMPMAMMAGDGTAYRERLLSLGLVMTPGKFARDALQEYIATARPGYKARCVSRTGWQGRTYVGAVQNHGESGERHILQTGAQIDHAYRRAGTLDDWREKVARLARGNSRLIFAISAAFAAPLLHPAVAEGGGFHFRGGSSTGKTTALTMAGSVWGGGGVQGYVRTWRATSNGLEGVAAIHSDALLCLDEMGQVASQEVGPIAYMLANGVGKARAGRAGENRPAAEWRTLFLSSGEISLADKMAEDGKGRRSQAGQEVRIVDIAADAGAGHGLFEDLHGFDNGERFSDHLRLATAQNYGTAAPAFLDLLADKFDDIAPLVTRYRNEFVQENCPNGADGQVSRVAKRFGLVAAGGEMAAALKVVPWEPGEAMQAAATCFADWLAARGGIEPAEQRRAISTVRRFVELHGNSRFEAMGDLIPRTARGVQIEQRVANRVGFRRRNRQGGIEYVVLPEAWETEICAGLNSTVVAGALKEKGLLLQGKDKKVQVKVRLPGIKNGVRCYVITSDIFGDGTVPDPTDEELDQ